MSLRDQIIGADDLPYEDVDVPEWGCTLRIRGLTAGEAEKFGAELGEQSGGFEGVRARLLVRSVLDPESGLHVFEDGDLEVLGAKSSQVVMRLFETAQRLSGLGDSVDVEAGN